MRRVRPSRIMTAVGAGLAVLGVTTWATDPAWARAAGLDVWNVGRLEDQLRACRAEAVRLETQEATLQYQFELNRGLARDAAAGRRPLPAAAAELWRANKDRPGYAMNLSCFFRGPTIEARAAHHLLFRVETDPDLPAAEKAAAVARLRAEYTAAYGVPVP